MFPRDSESGYDQSSECIRGSVGTLGQIVKGIDQSDNIEVINWECGGSVECQELRGGCIRSRNIERSRVC